MKSVKISEGTILSIVSLVAIVSSQTVWIDVDTGKIVGVSKGQNQQANNYPNYNRPRYPPNYPGNQRPVGNPNPVPVWNCRNSQTGYVVPISSEVMVNAFPEIIQQAQRSNVPRYNNNYPHYHRRRHYDPSQYNQYGRRKRSTLNPEWVCTNSKTGDMLIVASEIMADKFPGTNQNANNQSPNLYPNNPWLNGQNLPTQQPGQNSDQNQPNWGQNNNQKPQTPPNWGQNIPTQQPEQKFPQNPASWEQNQPNWGQNIPNQKPDQKEPNWGQNNENNSPNWGNQNNNPVNRPTVKVPEPTEPPAIILTTKKPFPTLSEDIDWLKYLQTTPSTTTSTTTTSTTTKRPSLNSAIDGEGIIMPRSGFEK